MIDGHAQRRFMRYLAAPGSGGCRVWTGGAYKNGYGKFWLNGRNHLAHRVAFAIAQGRWPEPIARHKCDNPACCEPGHIEEGTYQENVQDCIERGRRRPRDEYRPRTLQEGARHYSNHAPEKVLRGERVGTSKLTAMQAAAIKTERLAGARLRPLAQKYGVSEAMISSIARGKSWAHVQPLTQQGNTGYPGVEVYAEESMAARAASF